MDKDNMNKNLDDQLKKVGIQEIEQMVAESFATVRKMKEDSERANKMWEEECERWRIEREEERKQQEQYYEQMRRESDARIAKYAEEGEKLDKQTRYYPLALLISTSAVAIAVIASIIRSVK